MSKAADQRKSQSMNEIAEMAAEIREAVAAINEAVKKFQRVLIFLLMKLQNVLWFK
ncbi:MAG: hypothetical protein CM15mP51_05540 [Porticoccaceae bacterium]|nr:MAG: hypothetical protein CM15mP51_05540 [Porticoccaceae bacterium]